MLTGMLLLGLYFMIALRFLPLRLDLIASALQSLFAPAKKKGTLSNFQIVMTNLGAVMGIGNMVGVASAIIAGGPGALFWMWLSAIFVSTLKYGEILLAMKYRRKDSSNQYVGGPMHYIRYGFGSKWLAVIYAILLCVSSFGIGNMVASNAMADALTFSTEIPQWLWGVVIMLVMGGVCAGGLRRVVKTSEILVPILMVLYVGACVVVMTIEADRFVGVVRDIIDQAFGLRPLAAASMGMAMKYGMSRGIFSHEAGMGSATLTHVQSETNHIVQQAMWGFIEVFLDTMVMCSLSGFIILMSSMPLTIINPVMLLSTVFESYFGQAGEWFVMLSIVLFGFASMVGWYFYGMKGVVYLSEKAIARAVYSGLFLVSLLAGSMWDGTMLWLLSDNFNGMVLWINVLVLFCLRKEIIATTKEMLGRKRKP